MAELEVRPRPPREPGSEAWSHVASLIGALAMSDMQSRMRESNHDAASWVREGLTVVRSSKPETRARGDTAPEELEPYLRAR